MPCFFFRQISSRAAQNITNSHSDSEGEALLSVDSPFLTASSESYLGPRIVMWARKSAEESGLPSNQHKPQLPPRPRPRPRPRLRPQPRPRPRPTPPPRHFLVARRRLASQRERGAAVPPPPNPPRVNVWLPHPETASYRPTSPRVPRPRTRPKVEAPALRGRAEVSEEVSLGAMVVAWADKCAAAEQLN